MRRARRTSSSAIGATRQYPTGCVVFSGAATSTSHARTAWSASWRSPDNKRRHFDGGHLLWLSADRCWLKPIHFFTRKLTTTLPQSVRNCVRIKSHTTSDPKGGQGATPSHLKNADRGNGEDSSQIFRRQSTPESLNLICRSFRGEISHHLSCAPIVLHRAESFPEAASPTRSCRHRTEHRSETTGLYESSRLVFRDNSF